MLSATIVWGMAAGLVHFVLLGAIYGNPVVDKLYATAMASSPGVRQWASKPKYMVTQFLGTQVEVFILTLAFLWLRPLIAIPGYSGAWLLGLLLAATRVYPRFWNMWIQSTYPRNLLAIEFVAGTIGTLSIATFLEAFAV